MEHLVILLDNSGLFLKAVVFLNIMGSGTIIKKHTLFGALQAHSVPTDLPLKTTDQVAHVGCGAPECL